MPRNLINMGICKIAYLCDGLVPECSDKVGCMRFSKPGMSDCHHTIQASHAINGGCLDPWNHPERFTHITDSDSQYIEYWEGEFTFPEI